MYVQPTDIYSYTSRHIVYLIIYKFNLCLVIFIIEILYIKFNEVITRHSVTHTENVARGAN